LTDATIKSLIRNYFIHFVHGSYRYVMLPVISAGYDATADRAPLRRSPMAKVRLHIEISRELADVLDGIAESEHVTRSEIVRRAISVLKTYREQRAIGRPHLGVVRDARRLDAEILGLLNSPAPTAETRALLVVEPPSNEAEILSSKTAPAPLPPAKSGPVSLEAVMSRWSPHAITP
jgi:hypothetical protein